MMSKVYYNIIITKKQTKKRRKKMKQREAEEKVNEIKEEKETRIFNGYKKRLSKDGKTRFNAIEYLCGFPHIDPYKMAASLMNDGVIILFDDTSISHAENKRKERKVLKLV